MSISFFGLPEARAKFLDEFSKEKNISVTELNQYDSQLRNLKVEKRLLKYKLEDLCDAVNMINNNPTLEEELADKNNDNNYLGSKYEYYYDVFGGDKMRDFIDQGIDSIQKEIVSTREQITTKDDEIKQCESKYGFSADELYRFSCTGRMIHTEHTNFSL